MRQPGENVVLKTDTSISYPYSMQQIYMYLYQTRWDSSNRGWVPIWGDHSSELLLLPDEQHTSWVRVVVAEGDH